VVDAAVPWTSFHLIFNEAGRQKPLFQKKRAVSAVDAWKSENRCRVFRVIADSLVAKSHKVTCLAKEICVVLVLYGSLFLQNICVHALLP
jgi:hypothetical protein